LWRGLRRRDRSEGGERVGGYELGWMMSRKDGVLSVLSGWVAWE
jgi:hypothetical protein